MGGTGGGNWTIDAPPGPDGDGVDGAPEGDGPTEDGAPRNRRAAMLGAALLVLAVGGVVAFLLLGGEDGGPTHPDRWAARVQPFVDTVEELRDLEFEHPVHVDFLDDAAFREEVTADEQELTDEDRESIEQATGLLRALGLVEGELDLFSASNDLAGEGILGFYSFETQRITMRGTELTPQVRTTLVHELTHALQDQHFSVGERTDALVDAGDEAATSALRAVVEGDAKRIETLYREELPAEDREALDEEIAAGVDEYRSDTAEVPPVLVTFQSAPYVLGEAMLALVEELYGTFAIDGIFEDPPLSEEHLLDPWTLLEDDAPGITTDPKVPDGGEELDRGVFGALGWMVVLAERVPMTDALDATDGWGADGYVLFEQDGATCIRMSYRGDTAEDTDEMRAALEAWIAADDEAGASVEQLGSELRFQSCDPGADASNLARGASEQALGIALSRTQLTTEILRQGAREHQARCFGDALVHAFTVEQLTDPTAGQDPAVQQRIAELAIGCR